MSQLLITCYRIYHDGAWLVKIYCFSVDNIVYKYQGTDLFHHFLPIQRNVRLIKQGESFFPPEMQFKSSFRQHQNILHSIY